MGINIFETKELPILNETQKVSYFRHQLYVGDHPNADHLGYMHFHSQKDVEEFKKTTYYINLKDKKN